MNIKTNDKMHRQIMKSMKVRVELANMAQSETEREQHLKAIEELSIQAGVLNKRF